VIIDYDFFHHSHADSRSSKKNRAAYQKELCVFAHLRALRETKKDSRGWKFPSADVVFLPIIKEVE
jgi:hypothetical protein